MNKAYRIWNLRNKDPKNESIRDSYRDLAIYSIMALQAIDMKFIEPTFGSIKKETVKSQLANKKKIWTKEEDDYLRDNFYKKPIEEIAHVLKRGESASRSRFYRIVNKQK